MIARLLARHRRVPGRPAVPRRGARRAWLDRLRKKINKPTLLIFALRPVATWRMAEDPVARDVDFSRSAVARYIQLASLFRRRVESGQWAVGPADSDRRGAGRRMRRGARHHPAGARHARGRAADRALPRQGHVRARAAAGADCGARSRPTGPACSCRARTRRSRSCPTSAARSRPVPHPIGTLAPSYRHLRRRHSRHGLPFLLADLFVDERLSAADSEEGAGEQDRAAPHRRHSGREDQGRAADADHRHRRRRDRRAAGHPAQRPDRLRVPLGRRSAPAASSSSARASTAATWSAST